MLLTRRQLQQYLHKIISETSDYIQVPYWDKLEDALLNNGDDFFIKDTSNGIHLKNWIISMLNKNETREKGPDFENIAMYIANIKTLSNKNDWKNLNGALGSKVKDSPAADLGAGSGPPHQNANISVKISSSEAGTFETTQTSIANLLAMQIKKHQGDVDPVPQESMQELSEFMKTEGAKNANDYGVSLNGNNYQIELPLGLLSIKFNPYDIINSLTGSDLVTKVKIKNVPVVSSAQNQIQKKLAAAALGNRGSTSLKSLTDDERKAIIEIANIVIIKAISVCIENNIIKDGESFDARIVNQINTTNTGQLYVPANIRSHIISSTSSDKTTKISVGKFKDILNAVISAKPIKKIDLDFNVVKKGVGSDQLVDKLKKFEGPCFRIYYGAPENNKFIISTPKSANDFTITVTRPDGTSDKASDANGVKEPARNIATSNSHFSNVERVGKLYLGKTKQDIPAKLNIQFLYDQESFQTLMNVNKTKTLKSDDSTLVASQIEKSANIKLSAEKIKGNEAVLKGAVADLESTSDTTKAIQSDFTSEQINTLQTIPLVIKAWNDLKILLTDKTEPQLIKIYRHMTEHGGFDLDSISESLKRTRTTLAISLLTMEKYKKYISGQYKESLLAILRELPRTEIYKIQEIVNNKANEYGIHGEIQIVLENKDLPEKINVYKQFTLLINLSLLEGVSLILQAFIKDLHKSQKKIDVKSESKLYQKILLELLKHSKK